MSNRNNRRTPSNMNLINRNINARMLSNAKIANEEAKEIQRLARSNRKSRRAQTRIGRLNNIRTQRSVNALTRQFNLVRPTFNNTFNNVRRARPGSVRLSNREFISSVNIGLTLLNIEPGNTGCKVLDTMASIFDNYKFHSVKIEYVSGYSTNDSGQIIMGYDYNGAAPTTELQIAALMNSVSTTVFKNLNYTAIRSRLMKTKSHATFGSISASTTVPTKAATFAAFLKTSNTSALSQFWISYDITFENSKGAADTIAPTTVITSQQLIAPTFPQPVPSTVSSNQDQAQLISAVEINSIDPTNNNLVNGFNIGIPSQGENFSIVQSIDETTSSFFLNSGSAPTIRVRDTNGNIIPSSYYSINGDEVPTMFDKSNVVHINKFREVANINGFFGWIGAVVSFVKDVASIVHVGSGILLEIISPFASEQNVLPTVVLNEQATACSKGLVVDVTLPQTAPQVVGDTLNDPISIFFNQFYTSSTAGTSDFILNVPSDPGQLPSTVFLGYRPNGSTSNYTNINLSDNTRQEFDDSTGGYVYALWFTYSRSFILDNFGPGDVIKVSVCLATNKYSIIGGGNTGISQPIIANYGGSGGNSAEPFGPLATTSDYANFQSVGIIPTVTSSTAYDHYFTLDPTWYNTGTSNLGIAFDLSSTSLTASGIQQAFGIISANMSKFTDSDRTLAMPIPTSINSDPRKAKREV